ncbi:hypothetical protein LguiB_005845 [Lonicera macranthoides]
MEPAATIVTEEIVKGVVAQIKHHFSYLSHYHKNLGNLNSKIENLEGKRGRVQRLVDASKRNSEDIEDDVAKWLEKSKNEMIEAGRILKDKDKVENGCWNGWCRNLNQRYHLSKNAIKIVQNLDALLAEGGQFPTVACPQIPSGVVCEPTAPHLPETTSASMALSIPREFDSRRLILREIIEALKDDSIHIVRICGMGGVGKTTMLKEVEKRAREQYLFDEIGKAELTDKPDIRRIQGYLARSLGLVLKEDDALSARADQVRDRLNYKDKRILLIVDNVWRGEDMEQVGIALSNQQMHCKILLTSRSEDVCAGLKFQKMFRIGVLSDQEAWLLFQDIVGHFAYAPHMYKVAKKIVEECGGLSLAIATIASALSNKTKVTWDDVLGQLEKSALAGEYAAVFNSLTASYDFLEPPEMKDCFLLCCLFPEGFDVPIEELVRYAMGLRLFKNVDSLREARTRAHAHVEKLVNSNLLLVSEQEECVKMHDIVRDFAVATASKGSYMVRHGHGPARVTEWPMEDTYEHYTSISVRFGKMDELPYGLDCPNLKLLLLLGERSLLSKCHENFYEGMGGLNVLALMGIFIPFPPNSLELLTNLRTLSLNNFYNPIDISTIVNMKKLEVLSLADSCIVQIPREFGKLIRLRLLDLTHCFIIDGLAPGVLSCLVHLEELYMGRIETLDEESARQIRERLHELNSLPKLSVLDIEIPYEDLPIDIMLENLEKFKISIHPTSLLSVNFLPNVNVNQHPYLFQNSLRLILVEPQDQIKVMLKKTEVLYIEVQHLKTFLNDSEEDDFSNMKRLTVKRCNDLVHLVNTLFRDRSNVFPMLEELRLDELNNLEEIYHIQHPVDRFSKVTKMEIPESPAQLASLGILRFLHLCQCRKLESLFPLYIARDLVNLERLEITECEMMKELFSKNRGDQEDEITTFGKIEFPSLKYLYLSDLQNLVSFCQAADAVVLPQLVELELTGLPKLTSLFTEVNSSASNQHNRYYTINPLFNQKGTHTVWAPQKLRSLKVICCSHLRQVFTLSIAIFLGELQHLELQSCSSLQATVATEGNGEEGYILRWLSMKTLILENCGRESDMFANTNSTGKGKNDHEMALPSLEYIQVSGMDLPGLWSNHFHTHYSYKLKTMDLIDCNPVSPGYRSIPGYDHLEKLSLRDCDSIKVLFDLEKLVVGRTPMAVTFNRLDVLKMWNLKRMTHVWKKSPHGFEGFRNLTRLYLYCCGSLRYLFSPPIAKFLVNLQVLKINSCEVMEEVVSRRDAVEGQEDVVDMYFFPELQYLELHGLPNLLGIGPGAYAFDMLSLGAPNVGSTSPTSGEKLQVSGPESAKSSATPATQVIAQCQLPAWSFCNLKIMTVSECHKLLYAIPSNTVARLHNLKKLMIKRCHSLVEIFEDEQHLSASLGFLNLNELTVKGCDSMKYLFHSSTVKRLLQIKKLSVSKCKMMDVIMREEEEVEAVRISKLVVFPHLESLQLSFLPSLRAVCLDLRDMEWPLLCSVKVYECQEMKIFTTGLSCTPYLHSVRVNMTEYYAEEDLNTIIKRAQSEMKREKGDESEDECTTDSTRVHERWLGTVADSGCTERLGQIREVRTTGIIDVISHALLFANMRFEREREWMLLVAARGNIRQERCGCMVGSSRSDCFGWVGSGAVDWVWGFWLGAGHR